jgi:hypothetical protein
MLLQMQTEYTLLAVLGKQKQNPWAIWLHQLNIPFNSVTRKKEGGGGGGEKKKKKKVSYPLAPKKKKKGGGGKKAPS